MTNWNPRLSRSEQLARAQRQLARGTIDGRASRSAPVSVRNTMQTERPATQRAEFSGMDASLVSGGVLLPPYIVNARGHITGIAVAGPAIFEAELFVNGIKVDSLTRDLSTVQFKTSIDVQVDRFDEIAVRITSDSSSAFSVLVELIELH